jgi:hypothetical protein
MAYTEEDEQRVYEEINRAVAKEMRSPSRLPQDEFMRHIARVALDAMGRKPVTAEQVEAYCKERGMVVMTKNIAEHLTRQAR